MTKLCKDHPQKNFGGSDDVKGPLSVVWDTLDNLILVYGSAKVDPSLKKWIFRRKGFFWGRNKIPLCWKSPQNVIFWWFFKVSPTSKIIFRTWKHIRSDIFEGFWAQFEAQNMVFTPALDVGDQSILARIPFESYYVTISTQSKQETLFSMIFQTSSKV